MLSEPWPSAPEAVLTSRLWRAFCVHKDTHGVEGKARLPELDHIYSPFVLTPQAPGPFRVWEQQLHTGQGTGSPVWGAPLFTFPDTKPCPRASPVRP